MNMPRHLRRRSDMPSDHGVHRSSGAWSMARPLALASLLVVLCSGCASLPQDPAGPPPSAPPALTDALPDRGTAGAHRRTDANRAPAVGDRVRVELADGDAVEGEVLEIVLGSHVLVRDASGRFRRILQGSISSLRVVR